MPKPSNRILRFEPLEIRTNPAVTASLSAGTLTIFGSIAADQITVSEASANLSIANIKIKHGAINRNSVPVTAVKRIFIAASSGDDVINLTGVSVKSLIIGGRGDDTITGGAGADDIFGRDGHDSLIGAGGNDRVFGEKGDDTILGAEGNDTLFGSDGDDVMSGEAGNDLLYLEAGNDTGSGNDGNDTVRGNVGDDSLLGGAGNDHLYGEDGVDSLDGEAGNDYTDGGSGNDTIAGSAGNDEIFGLAGNDAIDGGDGNDTVRAGTGDDAVEGGLGDDYILGELGDDTLHGGAGNDMVAGGAGIDFVYGDDGDDVVSANVFGEVVDGGLGADVVSGNDGDILNGDGDDTIISGGGGDNGGDGGGIGGGGGGANGTGTVFQTLRSQWGDGATNDIVIRNTSSSNINGWKVEFDADFEITEIWNAQIVSHDANRYTIQNIPGFWNTIIKPNTLIVFGFNSVLDSGDSATITNIELNDKPLNSDPPPAPNPNSNTTGTVTQAIRSQWVDGTTNDLTIRNTGTSNINGWTITFEADFEVTDVWNAQLISKLGNVYTIRNIPGFWNSVIKPNTEIKIGFNTHFESGDSLEIRNETLNGNPA